MLSSQYVAGARRTFIKLFGLATLILGSSAITETSGANAKTPGKTYCYNRICHRVLTLAETRRAVGKRHSLIASYYSHCKVDRYNPCGLTSSGARFRPGHADNAASPIYPNGTKLLVWNPSNKRAAVVRIDNAGPYWRNRTLDLSRAAAQRLGFRHRGVARLVVQVLQAPTRRQATYRRYRKYAPVRGYLGRFASLNTAVASINPAAPSRAFANVTLPVKNTYKAERRIWLARMVEAGPVSVGLVKRPNLRLPVRFVRAEFDGWKHFARSRNLKIAALGAASSRSSSRSRSRPIRDKERRRKNRQKSNPVAKPVTPAAPSTRKPIKNSPKTSRPTPTTTANAGSPAKQTVEQSRPPLRWRHEILGVARGGA